MMKFKELDFTNFEEYTNHFFDTLLLSNNTYEYFVDWKVVEGIKKKIHRLKGGE